MASSLRVRLMRISYLHISCIGNYLNILFTYMEVIIFSASDLTVTEEKILQFSTTIEHNFNARHSQNSFITGYSARIFD